MDNLQRDLGAHTSRASLDSCASFIAICGSGPDEMDEDMMPSILARDRERGIFAGVGGTSDASDSPFRGSDACSSGMGDRTGSKADGLTGEDGADDAVEEGTGEGGIVLSGSLADMGIGDLVREELVMGTFKVLPVLPTFATGSRFGSPSFLTLVPTSIGDGNLRADTALFFASTLPPDPPDSLFSAVTEVLLLVLPDFGPVVVLDSAAFARGAWSFVTDVLPPRATFCSGTLSRGV